MCGIIAALDTDVYGDELSLESEAAIVMEAHTGRVIYEKNPELSLPPASITKIMTLLIIFDELSKSSISLTDPVTVSEHAASMGGSQIFLEPMEVVSVETLVKAIAVASANDASVAMAEYIGGTEEGFVERMNERARELGMNNTTFVNCCGLDTEGHMSSVRDVALMSRELINTYPEIHDYSTIWMDTIVHSTKKGDKEFGLTNTNKLLKQYQYATGLKTGSTSKAGCCLSATATKDNIDLIAVVMNAPNSKSRFSEAIKLLNYGFSKCVLYTDELSEPVGEVAILKGVKESVAADYAKEFSYVFLDKVDESRISRQIEINESIEAPIGAGDVLGRVSYYYEDSRLGEVDIVASESVERASFLDVLKKTFLLLFC